jgi:tripartite ATP-independent transporter DctM subunit
MAADLALLFGVMLLGMAVGMPVFLAMALSAGAYWLAFPAKLPLAIIGQTFAQGIDSYTFAAIPFFFLAGEVMNTGGISRRLLRFARAGLGHVKGGLAHVNIVTNMVFAGVSGSAVADASAVGAVMIPAMKKEGYPAEYAAAVTAAAATIGPVIPPSIPMVIFGLLASTSIGKLFIGGVVPGLLMGLFLLMASWLLARRRRFPAGHWQGIRELLSAGRDAALAMLTPFIVIAGLIFGVATTTEIGAVAALYAALVSVLVYRELTIRELWAAFCKSAADSAAVLAMASVAGIFTWLLANLGVGKALASWVGGITRDPSLVLLLIVVVLLLAGTVLEPVTTLLVLVPLMIPLVVGLGVDLTHFGLIVVVATCIGLLLPPIGFLIYLTAAQAGCGVMPLVRELVPFIAALVLLLMMMTFFPQIVLFLPNLLVR